MVKFLANWQEKNSAKLKFLLLIAIVVLPSFFYLTARAMETNSWDEWGFGSAQTMLTMNYWQRDGFVEHKLLFIIGGYHPDIKFLDKPEFRQFDKFQGGSINNNGRLYYTHYPPGYLFPYGFLAKLGFENRFWFRMLAIGLSFSALVFLAGFVYFITKRNKWLALLAVFFYSTSTSFLGYADSLANMPIDDFFKYLILFLSVYAVSSESDIKLKNILNKIIWLAYFLLAFSSYDATFFIFFWLCALNLIITKRIDIKKYILWALAPISAFAIQMIQNAWYLGINGMLADFLRSFTGRSGQTPMASDSEYLPAILQKLVALPPVIKDIGTSLSTINFLLDARLRMIIISLPIIILITYIFYKRKVISRRFLYYILALGTGGLIYGFIFPIAGFYSYQGRQWAPALLLIISIATYKSVIAIRKKEINLVNIILILAMLATWTAHFNGTFNYIEKWPNNAVALNKIEHWQELNKATNQNTIVLSRNDSFIVDDRYFQEFYSDRLTLWFYNINDLLPYMSLIKQDQSVNANFLLEIPRAEECEIVEDLKSMKVNFEEVEFKNIREMAYIKIN